MFGFMKYMFAMGKLCCAPMTDDEVAALKASHDAALKKVQDDHKAELDKLKPPPKKEDDPSLSDKARQQRELDEKNKQSERSLESAVVFNQSIKDFMKNNVGLLPKTIESLFTAAEKETFDSQVQKANELKVGIVQEFFAVQANLDLLTAAQKVELEDFLKLTKTGKQDRAQTMYAMIFEPALETLRKVEKAKQVGQGSNEQSSSEKALAEKMFKASRKHYLGDKE